MLYRNARPALFEGLNAVVEDERFGVIALGRMPIPLAAKVGEDFIFFFHGLPTVIAIKLVVRLCALLSNRVACRSGTLLRAACVERVVKSIDAHLGTAVKAVAHLAGAGRWAGPVFGHWGAPGLRGFFVSRIKGLGVAHLQSAPHPVGPTMPEAGYPALPSP